MKRKNIFCIYALTALLLTGCSQNNNQTQETPSVPETTTETTDSAQPATPGQTNENQKDNSSMISSDEAKAIALKHAGLTEDQVTILKCDLDRDHDDLDYDVEFYTEEQLEYDYEIDAYTGKILGYDLDGHYTASNPSENNQITDGDGTTETNGVTQNTIITEEEAIKIALDQVPGAKQEHIREINKDYDDGRLRYEVEILYEQKEYEFDINAEDGSILEWDKY